MVCSLLASATGDAFGAPHEGGVVERAVWRVIGRTTYGMRRWTDDTRMTLDIVETLIEHGEIEQESLARRFAESYRWSRGYGPASAKQLKKIRQGVHWSRANRSVYPHGSYGNGAAMRAAIIGVFFAGHTDEKIIEQVRLSAEITHAHPLAIEGAALVALAAACVCRDLDSSDILNRLEQQSTLPEFRQRLEAAAAWLEADEAVSYRQVASGLGNSITAAESCVTAIYAALRFRHKSLKELLAYVIGIGGDVDTIAAMACGIWGAGRQPGDIPYDCFIKTEDSFRIRSLGLRLAEVAGQKVGGSHDQEDVLQDEVSSYYRFPLGFPLLVYPVMALLASGWHEQWYGWVLNAIYLLSVGYFAYLAASRKAYEKVKAGDPTMNRATWMLNWGLFFVAVPLLVWLFFMVPAYSMRP